MDSEMEFNQRSGCWEGPGEDGSRWIGGAMAEAQHMATKASESTTLALVAIWLADGELQENYGVDIEDT